MLNLLKALRQDEYGVILSAEIVIVGSLLVIGLITGMTCLQQSVNGELKDLAGAVGSLDQSYSFSAHRKQGVGNQCCAWTAGSSYTNCEYQADQCTDIVGCTAPCGNCGQCEHCGHRADATHGGCGSEQLPMCAGGIACATCGGRPGGCGVCGGGGVQSTAGFSIDGYQPPRKARCIEPGVPKMKVSEWPLDCPPSSGPAWESVIHGPAAEGEERVLIVPHGHSIPGHSEIVEPHRPDQHHHPGRHIEHSAPRGAGHPQFPVPDSHPVQPMPRPPAQPIPSNDPLPMPGSEQPDLPASTT